MKILKQTAVCLFITLQIAGATLAADGVGSQFGGLFGVSVPDAEDVNPHKISGIKGDAFMSPTFSLGGYFISTYSNDIGSGATPFTYYLPGVETAYHMGGSSGDTFVGVRAGISKIKTVQGNMPLLFSPYHYGIYCGYDYFISSWMTLGFDGSYLFVQSDRTTKQGTEYKLDSFGILSFFVALQFRL